MRTGEIKAELDQSLFALQEDYNQCVKILRKTYSYLEQVGIKEFNKYSKYKWSLDRDQGCSYVCIRYGNSLKKKTLVKSSAYLDDAELYKWIDCKEPICEALDEACQYIRDKVKTLKRKMEATKSNFVEYEEKLKNLDEDLEEVTVSTAIPLAEEKIKEPLSEGKLLYHQVKKSPPATVKPS